MAWEIISGCSEVPFAKAFLEDVAAQRRGYQPVPAPPLDILATSNKSHQLCEGIIKGFSLSICCTNSLKCCFL